MNRKQLFILLALVIVIGGAALVHYHRQTASWNNSNPQLGQKLLGKFQVNDVAQIRMQHGTNELNLVKTNGLWRVRERGDYPADFSRISQFLVKLSGLKIVQTVPAGPSQWPRLELAAPGAGTNSATLLELAGANGQPLRTLRLGKMHLHQSSQPSPEGENPGWPDGRYVLADTNSPTVAVISEPLNEADPQPSQWLDKTFFRIEKPRSISVDFPNATNSWKLVRASETNAWKLADAKPGEKLSKAKASETAGAFSSPSFEDVAANAKPAQTGLDRPTRVEIKTFDGFDYAMNVGKQTNDNYYFTVNVSAKLATKRTPGKKEKPAEKAKLDQAFQANLKKLQTKLARESALSNWVYEVPGWSLNPLLKKRSQLLVVARTKAPAATKPPTIKTKS
jgi:Domain of unknown function (DUF4340)